MYAELKSYLWNLPTLKFPVCFGYSAASEALIYARPDAVARHAHTGHVGQLLGSRRHIRCVHLAEPVTNLLTELAPMSCN